MGYKDKREKSAADKRWKKQHAAYIKDTAAKYYSDNKEYFSMKSKVYMAGNLERVRQREREYSANHQGQRKECAARRLAAIQQAALRALVGELA